MKLHLGCGPDYKEGYVNIDLDEFPNCKVDRKFNLEEPLDYPDNSVEEISAYHLFEHLRFSKIEAVINSWYRVLAPGGKLIMEMPDFDQVLEKAVQNPNDNVALASIFGSQDREGQYHHWGWNKTRLKFMLEGVGFKDVTFPPPQDYHKDLEPCLRVEATK